ncbi:MAG: AsmA-like C-terminal region-containing protein, partial [Hyphomicrobiales bacterium]
VNLDINMPRIGGAIATSGSLVWKKQPITLNLKVPEPVKLATGGATSMQIAVSSKPLVISYAGAVSLKNAFQMNGALNAKAPNLRSLAPWLGQPFAPGNGLGAFAIQSQVAYANDKLTLTKAKLSLDQTNAQGSVVVLLKSNVPVVSARLGVDQINVNYYMAGGKAKASGGSNSSSGGGAAPSKAGWSTKPIDFGGLRAGAANLALTAGRIIYGKTTLSNVSMTAKLHRGVLTTNIKKMNLYGGRASGQIVLNGSKKVPVISGSLKASGVKSLTLMRDFANFDWIEGAAAVNMKLAASGRNQAQLVQTLRGNMVVKFTNGAIRGVDIDRLLGDVSKNILNGWNLKASDRTQFKEMSANFKIQKGRASTNALKFNGPKVRITGKGNVNLPPRTLNFKFAPAYVASLQGKDVKSPIADISKLPIKVKGPWANPKIYPDVKGILQNPELAYKTIDNLLTNTGVLKDGQSKEAIKKVQKKVEKETIDKVENAVAKGLGDENAKALKDASKQLLKGLFGNN